MKTNPDRAVATVTEIAVDGTGAVPPVVMVTWQDAWADSDQHDRSEWRSDYLVRTTGFLVRNEPDVVSVAQEILPEEDGFRAVTHIPRAMIRNVASLSEPVVMPALA